MERIRTCCNRLYQNYLDFEWIIDDESYFTLDHSSINGKTNFYSSNTLLTPSNVKYSQKEKFSEKTLVWVTISPKGVFSLNRVFYYLTTLSNLYIWSIVFKRDFPVQICHYDNALLHIIIMTNLCSGQMARSYIFSLC